MKLLHTFALFLCRYVWLYNQHLPQKALNHQTSLTAIKKWQESHPHLFIKKVINHPGSDISIYSGLMPARWIRAFQLSDSSR